MSGTPYIDQSTLDEAREARRQGRTLEQLAGQLRCDPAHLARLLGVATTTPAVEQPADYLWSTDRLDGVL